MRWWARSRIAWSTIRARRPRYTSPESRRRSHSHGCERRSRSDSSASASAIRRTSCSTNSHASNPATSSCPRQRTARHACVASPSPTHLRPRGSIDSASSCFSRSRPKLARLIRSFRTTPAQLPQQVTAADRGS
jgi:hypothetical protein